MVTGLVDFPEKGYNVIILVFGSRANNNYCGRSLCVSPAAGIFPIKYNFFCTPIKSPCAIHDLFARPRRYSIYTITVCVIIILPWTAMLAGVLVVNFLVRVCIIWHVYDENWSLDSRLWTSSSPVCIAWYFPSEMIKNECTKINTVSSRKCRENWWHFKNDIGADKHYNIAMGIKNIVHILIYWSGHVVNLMFYRKEHCTILIIDG